MNPEDRIAELNAQIETAKAEIAQLKATQQMEKAEVMNTENMNMLTGDRDEDGTLKPENDLAAWYDVMVKQAGEDWMDNPVYKTSADWYKSQLQTTNTDDLVDTDAVVTGAGDVVGAINEGEDKRKETMKGLITEKQIADPDDDIDKDTRKDEVSEDMVFAQLDREQGRTKGFVNDIPERSMGFKADDGGNMSVDEKDDFWKTQEGYNKAMEMYGSKPAWIPDEPTMVFNPTTQEYEEIKDEDKEEFVDFAQPRMSADLKALLG